VIAADTVPDETDCRGRRDTGLPRTLLPNRRLCAKTRCLVRPTPRTARRVETVAASSTRRDTAVSPLPAFATLSPNIAVSLPGYRPNCPLNPLSVSSIAPFCDTPDCPDCVETMDCRGCHEVDRVHEVALRDCRTTCRLSVGKRRGQLSPDCYETHDCRGRPRPARLPNRRRDRDRRTASRRREQRLRALQQHRNTVTPE